ncbi:glycosyltransferase family 2 protein [Microbacterium hydrocarbonoxydans]|uniref:glycosyltransferase family 2 protein n=1 Tax=Microbacterium hydrocarbonoxydans TaxID=273678 RepID=UPI00203FF09A|nr:glycosyltransferase family 2 protein [Microbacterium hydrocarbonoxydans]MCM3778119.1 glycosyltransferase family 2 protein [Microbacterium hydrocarbonoxydans]
MRLAVVVVNYASSALLRQNLVRTCASVDPDIVVVVDNLSSDEERSSVRLLAESARWHLVEPSTNLGFGGGMNAGVERALDLGAQDLLLLNPDATITHDAVRALQDIVAESRFTVVAPRIVDSAGDVWFDGADLYLSDGRTMGASKRDRRPDEERWEWLSGACLLIPAEIWRRTGGFDDEYFLYWEDVDFSRRVVAAGGTLVVAHEATAVHDEGGTQGRDPSDRAKSFGYYYFNIRNRLLFAAKQLDDEGVRRWRRGAWRSAREVLLRGGRRQFLRPWAALVAAYRGVRDGRRLSLATRGRRRQPQ